MRLGRFLFAVVMLVVLPAQADESVRTEVTVQSVIARLGEPKVLRGSFRQERNIELLSQPLVSTGIFILSQKGLYWRQEHPLKSTLIADDQRLVQQIEDEAPEVFDADSHPMILPFSRIFLSIFRGTEDELRKHFDIAFEPRENGWQIALTPISYPLSEAIDSISLDGSQYIEVLSVTSRTSDETVIRFSELCDYPDHLTEHELQLYAP